MVIMHDNGAVTTHITIFHPRGKSMVRGGIGGISANL